MPTVRGGTSVTFSGGPDGSLTATLRLRLLQVIADTTLGAHFLFANGGTSPALAWTPQNSVYFPSYFAELFSLFQHWKCGGAVLDYEPRVNTSNPATFILASTDDPCWIKATGQTNGTGSPVPTEAALTSLKNACTVVGYARCKMNLTMNKEVGVGGWAYTMSDIGVAAGVNWDTTPSASLRQTVPCVLLVAGTANGATNGQILGDVYASMTISLKEFSLYQSTNLPGNIREAPSRWGCKRCLFNASEEKKLDRRPRSLQSLHPDWEEDEFVRPVPGVDGKGKVRV